MHHVVSRVEPTPSDDVRDAPVRVANDSRTSLACAVTAGARGYRRVVGPSPITAPAMAGIG